MGFVQRLEFSFSAISNKVLDTKGKISYFIKGVEMRGKIISVDKECEPKDIVPELKTISTNSVKLQGFTKEAIEKIGVGLRKCSINENSIVSVPGNVEYSSEGSTIENMLYPFPFGEMGVITTTTIGNSISEHVVYFGDEKEVTMVDGSTFDMNSIKNMADYIGTIYKNGVVLQIMIIGVGGKIKTTIMTGG